MNNTDKEVVHRWYHTDISPTLTKSSLGKFVYSILKNGAILGDAFLPTGPYHRAPVEFALLLTEEQKDQIEKETGVKFKYPPKSELF